MIQLELKAKHFYLAADILLKEAEKFLSLQPYLAEAANVGIITTFSQPIIDNIKTACQNTQDDDLVTVETEVKFIVTVFKILAQKPEGSYNMVNTEMIELLTPQIAAGVTGKKKEWISLNDQITEIKVANLEVITNAITDAKNKLYN